MLHVLLTKTLAQPIWARRWLWLLYMALWGFNALLSDSLATFQNLLVLTSLVLFVIPHGTADFYIPAWILNPPWENRLTYWAPATGLVILSAFVTFGIWKLSANFSIALFSALMMWHWGSLDTIHIYPHRGPSWVIGSVGRGMLVVIAPLYFKPLETQELILNFLGLDQSFILTTLYFFSEYLLALALVLEILAVLVNKFLEGRGLPALFSGHMAESILLLITFAWVSPILGFIFYFLMLHSVRHICRVPAYIPEARGNLIEGGGTLSNLSYFYQKTSFLTFVAILSLGAWFAWKIYSGACTLPLLLLMVPHTLVSLLADFNPKQLET